MDRALKERIVGAIVLVVVAVLVVPVFLDGPSVDDAVVTQTLPLPGQEDQDIKVVILDRDRATPVPAAERSQDSRPSSEPVTSTPEPVPNQPVSRPEQTADNSTEAADATDTAAATAPATAPPTTRRDPVAAIEATAESATGMWAVQIGSFSSKENADQLAADLRRQGFAAFLSETPGPSGAMHRVRVGPQKDRPSAEAMLSRLRESEQSGQVVPHP